MSIEKFDELKNRLAYILSKSGLSQTEFAKTIRKSDGYVSEILSGKQTNISPSLADLIALKFGYGYDWVKEGKEPMRQPHEKKEEADPEIGEIVEILKENPEDKALVLKLLKGKKDIKEALEGLKIKVTEET